jgi:uncharacterized protein
MERPNTLQTMAALIDAAWAKFFAAEDFLVGVSLVGPQEPHEVHRHDKQGRSSFTARLSGLQLPSNASVRCNVLVTVSK